uniref:A_deaminase domain-containing protein n=1 Tax=Meloidogyne hapla TaxID=6305 RepID=A0A1I8BZH8_MELHA
TVLIPLLDQRDEDFHNISLEENNKLAIHYYHIKVERLQNQSSTWLNIFKEFGAFFRQEKNINPHNCMITGDYNEIFFDMANNKKWIQDMKSKRFQLGIAELFDPLAFYILRLIGIERIVATSNMPLQSIFYHYLGYLEEIIEKGDIPG